MDGDYFGKGIIAIVVGMLLLGLAYFTTDETGFYPALYGLGGACVLVGLYNLIKSFFSLF